MDSNNIPDRNKKVIDPKELWSVPFMNRIGGDYIGRLLFMLLRFDKFNKVFSKYREKENFEFITAVVDTLGLHFEIDDEDMKRIPENGSFITVSNHPFGGLDSLLLLNVIGKVRQDYKVLPNSLLQRLQQIKGLLLENSIYSDNIKHKNENPAMNEFYQHLENGNPLGLFPAGDASTYHYEDYKLISDREWNADILRLIRNIDCPIVPVYFQGNNSRIAQVLSKIHPLVQTKKLPSNIISRKKKIIKIRIGKPIPVKERDFFDDTSQFGRYLRAKTYALGTPIEVKKFFSLTLKSSIKRAEKIIDPIDKLVLKSEIDKITKEYLLFRSQNFNVLCAPSIEIPNVLTEIGRLREITFREVGEGTNRSTDVDEFDLYYHQLIIWDIVKEQIVGAYRVGKGADIFAQYGINGFYIRSLFKINPQFYNILNQSLELGRSFIIKEYQKKPLSLFLLWKGILYFLLKHPEYRYLMGPVSISNDFSKFSKGMIIDFVKTNFFDNKLAEHITPRHKFKVEQVQTVDRDAILAYTDNDLMKLDKFIQDIEPNYRMPVLLKKYISLNAKIIGFNIDPKFNNTLDGLIILDLYDVPKNVIESLSKEVNDESILERLKIYDMNRNMHQKGVHDSEEK